MKKAFVLSLYASFVIGSYQITHAQESFQFTDCPPNKILRYFTIVRGLDNGNLSSLSEGRFFIDNDGNLLRQTVFDQSTTSLSSGGGGAYKRVNK